MENIDNKLFEKSIKILKDLIGFKTISGENNSSLINYCEDILKKNGATSFKVFDEIYLLTQGGPGTSTEVISFSIYETFFESDNMGLGSVMSVVSLFVVSLLIIIVLNVIRRVNKYAN